MSNYWHLEIRPQGCFNLFGWIIATSCIETSTDIICLLIPLPLLYIVKIGLLERMILLGLFILGAIPSGFALMRTIQLVQWQKDSGSLLQNDFSWYLSLMRPCSIFSLQLF